ncbi:MAG: flagellar filament capping protein FliD [Candidatus Desulfofervidaceae bacterium]|nr:flagellar filament capping protein FliD [Candidatus Desulfofervidaceae bacterium]
MPGTFFISGLYSGIDWSNVIEQIMQVERKRETLLEDQKQIYQDKLSAWQELNTKLLNLKTQAEGLSDTDAFNVFNTSLTASSGNAEDILTATAGSNAVAGSYEIKVLSLAQSQSLQSQSFSDTTSALELSGEILINGQVIQISSTDSLSAISGAINAANAGVKASIVQVASNDYRLVLTAEDTGSAGFTIANGDANNLVQALGFASSTKTVLHPVSSGAESNRFSDASTAVGTLLGLSSPPSGTVQVAGVSVSIDLSTDTLNDIADKINTAWQGAGNTGNIASVVQDGSQYYLKIDTTNFQDANNVLEVLGILKSEQTSVAEVQETDKANTSGGNPITASTLITAIDTSTGNPKAGETITIQGTDHNGNAVNTTFTIQSTSTVQDLLDAIQTAFNVTPSVTSDGKLQFIDNASGESQLSISIIANNESGGGLDFGNVNVVTQGREMEISAGADAQIEVNGVVTTRSSNQITDVIQGVTLTLKQAASDVTVNLTVNRDIDQMVSNIQDFFNQVNEVFTYINDQSSYSEGDESAPPLIGDTTLSLLRGDLRDKLTDGITWDSTTHYLFEIGVNVNNDGTYTIDEDKLRDALTNNFDTVKNLFTQSDTGVAVRMNDFLDFITDEYSSGYVQTRMDEIQTNIDNIDKRIEEMERRFEMERERLYEQFNALETYLAQMRQTQQWLNQQLGNLTSQ